MNWQRTVAWRCVMVILIGIVLVYRTFAATPFGDPNPGFDFDSWCGFTAFVALCFVVARQAARQK